MWVDMWSSVENGSEGPRAAPCSRGKHSATLLGGYVYVLGGRGAGGSVPLRDFWRYCLASGVWERIEARGEAPPALQEHSASAHGQRLYVFGGEAGALSSETPLWIYDTEIRVWRKLAGQPTYTTTLRRRGSKDARGACAGPRGRRGHSAHTLKDCLLIYGGYKDLRGSTNELWAFHYESESWQAVRTAGAGPARHRHAAALHRARLYVHGGQCDLRDCADLWHYDTISRVWTQVRTPAKLSPSARSGHAGLRAGAHFYIFGGEANGHSTNELWRFHFESETWERIVQSLKWPSPRVDCSALLVPWAPSRAADAAGRGRGAAPPAAGGGLLREISKLSSVHLRRGARCSYSVLAAERDSTESLVRHEAALAKSHSAYAIDERQPADGHDGPREADPPDGRGELAREPVSVPDFVDVVPAPAAPPAPAVTKLVYLDSDEEEEARRRRAARLPKSASVRFTRGAAGDEDEAELSTSDYASAERVNRVAGFSNPHYLGPDVRALGAARTPDSGVGDALELRALAPRRPAAQLHVLLLGGREPPHLALLQAPLSMWTYRLL
ncbi:rab9 effector protein with kelch motifs-like isoform X2 [Galleria mellonella]|uniref:Rab9 effector protein with kelch motifs-like isoform X2 n=1 Tax=Galleria mellonella TaxID=7137 RepID=A0ABM3MPS1_GALME|nr:rab9 effector protein with kelch motifs-like isoform X2 [Galleria mellonella]